MQVRNYKRADADGVYNLVASIFASEFSDIPSKGFLADLENVEKNYGQKNEGFWVVEQDGRIVGVAGVKQEDGSTALLRRLFVNPNYRGRGIGSALVKEVLDFCKEHSYKKVSFLGNSKMSAAKNALLSMGFKEEEGVDLGQLSVYHLKYFLA